MTRRRCCCGTGSGGDTGSGQSPGASCCCANGVVPEQMQVEITGTVTTLPEGPNGGCEETAGRDCNSSGGVPNVYVLDLKTGLGLCNWWRGCFDAAPGCHHHPTSLPDQPVTNISWCLDLRCMSLLDNGETGLWMVGQLTWTYKSPYICTAFSRPQCDSPQSTTYWWREDLADLADPFDCCGSYSLPYWKATATDGWEPIAYPGFGPGACDFHLSSFEFQPYGSCP